jgi:feruloyl esterase
MEGPVAIRRQEIPLANHVPQVKARAIAAEFMRQCDALDGLADGLINDYLRCREIFNVTDGKGSKSPWASRRCAEGRDPAPTDASAQACLTDGQIQTLQFIFSNQKYVATMAHGSKSFGMWAPSTEVAVGGLPPASGNSLLSDIRFKGQEGAAADARVFSSLGSLGVTGFLLQDLAANPLTFTESKSLVARRKLLSDWFNSNNPDLSAFQRRGGKLIVAIGTNDTLASPGAQLDYYAALTKRMGRQLDGFARLYVLPQRGHGLSGSTYTLTGDGRTIEPQPLPSQFDRMALLQQWVEQGTAPAHSVVVTGARDSTGLMCSYPNHPRYKTGAPDQATSWQCTK